MRTPTSSLPARRTLRLAERRLRRRPVLVSALAVGLIASVAFSTAAPASQAEASGPLANFAPASYTTTVPHAVTDAVAPSGADAALSAATAESTLSWSC